MTSSNTSDIEKFIHPFYMAGGACLLALVLMGLGKMAGFEGFSSESKGEFPWMISAAVLLMYIVFSSVASLLAPDINRHYKLAIPAYVILLIANSGLAYLFSNMTWIDEVGSYKWIYFVLTIGYLMMQLMTRFIKKIMVMAQREDDEFNRRTRQN